VFVGPYSPEAAGDYLAGPNHVLPTAGSARWASPLGVYDFVKRVTVIHYRRADLAAQWQDIARLARVEGLEAHARSVAARFASAGEEAGERAGEGGERGERGDDEERRG
jgi:histidinol dehydrogenase